MYGEWAKKQDLTEWGLMWIREHIRSRTAREQTDLWRSIGLGRPDRPEVYDSWLREIEDSDALGDLIWMIGLEGPGP